MNERHLMLASIFMFIFLLLIPMAFALTLTWTTTDDFDKGTYTNMTGDNNNLSLSGETKSRTGSYLSNTTSVGGTINSITATWNTTGLNWTQTSQADFNAGILTNVSATEAANSVALAPNYSTNDTFGDGDYTSNPVWTTDGSAWEVSQTPVSNNYILQRSSYDNWGDIYVSSNQANGVWEWKIFNATNYSSSHRINTQFYIMSDSTTTPWTGTTYMLDIVPQTNIITLYQYPGPSTLGSTSSDVLSGNHTYKFTKDGGAVKFYVDNVLKISSTSATPVASGKYFHIRGYRESATGSGQYDDVRIYNYSASGTFASQVLDTKYNGTIIRKAYVNSTVYSAGASGNANVTLALGYSNDNITWNYTANTTFASNETQEFDFADVTGRYLRWNATLQTNNTNTTPELHSVDIEYVPISVELSTDGATWLLASNNTQYSSGYGTGSNLRWRANLSTDNTSVTPALHDMNLTYSAGTAPQWLANSTNLPSPQFYNLSNNYGFQVNSSDSENNMNNTFLQLGRPDGTLTNYTALNNSLPGPNVWYYNFTQSAMGKTGTYNITWFLNDTENAQNKSDTVNYVINQAPLEFIISPQTQTIFYSTSVRQYCSNNITSVSCGLYRNSSLITNDTNVVLDAGDYNYTANITDTQNYTVWQNSSLLTVNYSVGVLFELNTTDSANKTKSFFSINEPVKIKANASILGNAPNISVYYPNGSSAITPQQMINETPFFSYNYTANTIGWHKVTVSGKDKYFYVGNNWTNWNDGNRTYPFRVEINITNNQYKYLYPVDLFIDFNYTVYNNSLRLTQFNGTEDFEVPHQLYNITYSENNIDKANVVFLFSEEQNRTYRLYYYTTDIGIKSYTTDLNLSNQTSSYSIYNDYFTAKFVNAYGGALSELYLKKGSNSNMSGYYPMQYSPRILKGETTIYPGLQTNPTITTESGPVYAKFRASGALGAYSIDYDLTYKFYAYSNTFTIETNTSSRETATWDTFGQYKIYFSASLNNLTFNSTVYPAQSMSNQVNKKYVGLFNNTTGYNDAMADLFLQNTSNVNMNPKIDFTAGGANNYYTRTLITEPYSASTGNWFYSKTARTFFNNYNPGELEKIYGSLNSTYSFSFKTESSDTELPNNTLVGYTPSSPTDIQNITCYSNWTDNLLVSYVIISENSTESFVNHTVTIQNQTGWANYTISNASTEAGVILCNFIAYDAALNSNSTNVSITVSDATTPYITNITYAPTSETDLDPGVMVNATANVTEYTAVSAVLLQYRMTNETSWTNSTMFNITPVARSTLYKGNFTPLEANYSFRVFANDTLGNTNVSDMTNISISYDWTWDRNPADFGSKSDALGNNITLGNLTINNTGDYLIRFRVSHNLERNLYFNNTVVSTGNYFEFDLNGNNKTFYSVKALAASVEKTDSLTITINALNSSANPDLNTTTATLSSYASGPYLFITITDYNLSLRQGDTGTFKAKIQNNGNQTATSTYLAWSLPSDWSLASGELNASIGTLAVSGIGWNNITASVGSGASTGTKTITANATSAEGKTGSDSKSVVVTTVTGAYCGDGTCQSGETTSCPSDCPVASTTSGGSSGGAGGISSVGSAALAKVFQTEEKFEIVRGKDKTFFVTIENPFKDANLENVSIRVSGFLSKYIKLEQETIKEIQKGKSINISIAIEAPAYFTKGSHNLTFTIEGRALKQEGNLSFVTEMKQTKALFLDIHDVGKSEAIDYLNTSLLALDQLVRKGFYAKDAEELLEKAKAALNSYDYETVKALDQEIATIKENAFSSDSAIADLEKKLKESKDQGITAEQTSRMLSLAKVAFSRGDYATALSRAKEAQLVFAAETKGEFNLLVFLIKNWLQVLIGSFLAGIALLLIYLRMLLLVVNRRLSLLAKEEGILLGLMKTAQKECFEDKKLSMEEYGEAMFQYESRLSKLVQEMINLETLRSSVFHLIQERKRLLKERERLLEIIKKTQRDFMEKGKYESRIYENKLKSYGARFGEVEERIAFLEAGRALRLKTGKLRLLWQLLEKFRKLKALNIKTPRKKRRRE